MAALVVAPNRERPVLGRVVDDEDFAVVVVEHRPRDTLEHEPQGRFGVVRDDEDEKLRPGTRRALHSDLLPR